VNAAAFRACATCHVYVDDAWREKPVGEPSPMEETCWIGLRRAAEFAAAVVDHVTPAELDGLVVTTPEKQA
jgi:2Fe-2S ferredoxin